MPKISAVRPLWSSIAVLCLAALGGAFPVCAQVPATALPTDPKALMILAAKSNGLTGPDMQPWHLKATFKSFDEKGNVTDQGTIDELWVSPAKYKCTFADTDSNETEYGTGNGIFISGNPKPQFSQADSAVNAITYPLPNPYKIDQLNYELNQREVGTARLACVNRKDANGNSFGRIWCLDANRPILRLVGEPLEKQEFLYNRILKFEGHYIAGDLQFSVESHLRLTAHLDSLERISTVDDAALIPPHDATASKVTRRSVNVPAELAQGFLIKMVQPEYPAILKASRIAGTVVLEGTIGIDGNTKDLQVISGPATLQQSALDAVKQWVYRPFLLEGEPVEVKTTIHVIFRP